MKKKKDVLAAERTIARRLRTPQQLDDLGMYFQDDLESQKVILSLRGHFLRNGGLTRRQWGLVKYYWAIGRKKRREGTIPAPLLGP